MPTKADKSYNFVTRMHMPYESPGNCSDIRCPLQDTYEENHARRIGL